MGRVDKLGCLGGSMGSLKFIKHLHKGNRVMIKLCDREKSRKKKSKFHFQQEKAVNFFLNDR